MILYELENLGLIFIKEVFSLKNHALFDNMLDEYEFNIFLTVEVRTNRLLYRVKQHDKIRHTTKYNIVISKSHSNHSGTSSSNLMKGGNSLWIFLIGIIFSKIKNTTFILK